jgi:hypothetical protein
MPKWFVYWEVEPTFTPKTPEERLKQWITMTEMVKADMEAGTLKDWGMRSGEMSGYGITKDLGVVELNAWLLKWTPYIKFEANPVITADQNLETLKKLAEMRRQ